MSQESSKSDDLEYTSTGVAEACGCGVTPQSNGARPEPRYNGWGVFSLLWGMSTVPKSVVFKCWKCNKVIAESEDPALVAQHGKT